jgi:hypothetical protein
MKSVYSGSAKTNGRYYGANGMTRMKLRENGILLSGKERSHDDGGKGNRGVEMFEDSDIIFICISVFVAPNNSK